MFGTLFVALSLVATPATAKTSSNEDPIQQAKTLLSKGQRRQAVTLLNRAAMQVKSKKQKRDLLNRRTLFAQQFLTSDSFQKYQEAKAFNETQRAEECLREIAAVEAGDQDNVLILEVKAHCQMQMKQSEEATKSLQLLLEFLPENLTAHFGLVEIALGLKQLDQAGILLEQINPIDSNDIEKKAILKARVLDALNKPTEAAEVLRQDQESNLDHVGVLYELGMLYARLPGNDWQARKTLSLFITRCKRMKEPELKVRGFTELLPKAQSKLSEIDGKLGV